MNEFKKFTVHIDMANAVNERCDYLLNVLATDVQDAVKVARLLLTGSDYGFLKSEVKTAEILDVFKGHVKSLWNRPKQRPNGEV